MNSNVKSREVLSSHMENRILVFGKYVSSAEVENKLDILATELADAVNKNYFLEKKLQEYKSVLGLLHGSDSSV